MPRKGIELSYRATWGNALFANISAMKQHLTILTGASRGMGLAMAQQLITSGHHLLCISR
ncbi:MAG: hypothetical protein RLZZ239_2277, partial [Pseudomonadota bacterium]